MKLSDLFPENERPLDRLVTDGGFASIFRTVACVGDSLSSGEFEAKNDEGNNTYHDMYEYSWGQYMARAAGFTVHNFSRGGMTAKEYMNSFAESRGFWNPDLAAQAYIVALGVNDLHGRNQPIGSVGDIRDDWREEHPDTFAGYYGALLSRYREIQPDARFFLMTMPRHDGIRGAEKQRALLYTIAARYKNTYVLDLYEYAPPYDASFREKFFLGGHMNPMGYIFTAQMTLSYIDYIIRHNLTAFKQVPFIGTPHAHTECPK